MDELDLDPGPQDLEPDELERRPVGGLLVEAGELDGADQLCLFAEHRGSLGQPPRIVAGAREPHLDRTGDRARAERGDVARQRRTLALALDVERAGELAQQQWVATGDVVALPQHDLARLLAEPFAQRPG